MAVQHHHQQQQLVSFSSPDSGLTYNASSAPRKRSRPISTTYQDLLLSHLYHQSLEIDATINFQNEKTRLCVEELQKKHYIALFMAVEQQMMKRIKDKEAELDDMKIKNLELEQNLRLLAEENQFWFSVAKNNEDTVCSLRSSLEQALVYNAAGAGAGDGSPVMEGFGESDGGVWNDEDAQSCCGGGDGGAGGRWRGGCKGCGERQACVVVLPCRHLCLCGGCQSKVDTCPVCMNRVGSIMHVLLP
ncbi:hypothetical protein J5N97_022166 [Dioscorea zingiberensis]|uniref:RING-type domain-containing protein n=1 Tax=Dioscorea zingiberensis TaxID=325984 RepID=A0A9D5HAD4_9LILI|nr:hypothetical protein J5N97_022166 [Dioscorea zingiberensis]